MDVSGTRVVCGVDEQLVSKDTRQEEKSSNGVAELEEHCR